MSDKKWMPEVGEKVRLVGINDSVEVVAQGLGDTFCAKFNDGSLTICSVSAIARDPTDEDKAVDDMVNHVNAHDNFHSFAKSLYRAGYRRQAEPAVDMSDPRNWREGDIVECVKFDVKSVYTVGREYKFKGFVESGHMDISDNAGGASSCYVSPKSNDLRFRFVRRP